MPTLSRKQPGDGVVTPYDRLVALLATDDCDCCGRYDVPDPAEAAQTLGVSETTLRRLMQPDAQPPRWSTIEGMAARLDDRRAERQGVEGVEDDDEAWTPVRLLAEVWPSLGSARPAPVREPVPVPDEGGDRE